MNFPQLEYIIAVDTYRHFVKAADACYVTQATLSTMIKKLEEELGIKIFDRTRQPVVPTDVGSRVIAQARVIMEEQHRLKEMISTEQENVGGELRIGILPTLAPYLLPLFLNSFLKNYPDVKLHISELTTDEIIRQLERNELDAGLLATPLHNSSIREIPLFYEEFVVYASAGEKLMKKEFILAKDIDVSRLWLLEEGHCLRSQVINLCELKSREKEIHQLDFAAGSIETLKIIVEINEGITIIPALAVSRMTARQQKNIRHFRTPAPVREIGIVTYRHFVKEKLIKALEDEIIAAIPNQMKTFKKREIIELVKN